MVKNEQHRAHERTARTLRTKPQNMLLDHFLSSFFSVPVATGNIEKTNADSIPTKIHGEIRKTPPLHHEKAHTAYALFPGHNTNEHDPGYAMETFPRIRTGVDRKTGQIAVKPSSTPIESNRGSITVQILPSAQIPSDSDDSGQQKARHRTSRNSKMEPVDAQVHSRRKLPPETREQQESPAVHTWTARPIPGISSSSSSSMIT